MESKVPLIRAGLIRREIGEKINQAVKFSNPHYGKISRLQRAVENRRRLAWWPWRNIK